MTKITYIISDIDKALAFEWIAQYLDRSRFQLNFILILQQPSVLETFLQQQGITCHSFYYKSKKDFPRILPQVYKLLRQFRPQTVHCHLLYGSLLGLTAARIAGVKKRIYTRHHSDFHHRYFPGGIKWDKWCNRMATSIVAPSNAVKKVLTEMEKVPASKVILIPHGFDLQYFNHVPAERIQTSVQKYNPAQKKPVIGVISRFTELKGIQYIIPAFKQLLKDYPEALILFFNARGDYAPVIDQLLADIPPANYRLIPFENDLAAIYPLFDIFVQASTDTTIEAFGQTYVEALAAGVPSVFTLSGIAPDFIENGKNALVVPFKDSNAIYEAMLAILGNEELRKKLKQEGWNSVKDRFALQQMIHQLENLYGA
ncbi:glycosyltransferase family 4 protein [Chitinophagaceae bacterium MMS25-I14]